MLRFSIPEVRQANSPASPDHAHCQEPLHWHHTGNMNTACRNHGDCLHPTCMPCLPPSYMHATSCLHPTCMPMSCLYPTCMPMSCLHPTCVPMSCLYPTCMPRPASILHACPCPASILHACHVLPPSYMHATSCQHGGTGVAMTALKTPPNIVFCSCNCMEPSTSPWRSSYSMFLTNLPLIKGCQ